jgi:hypothetical protein
MRTSFLLFTIIISASSYTQAVSTDEAETYPFDTTLKGGYSISFRMDNSLQYLYLKKGNKIIGELSSTSKGLPYQNLGYAGADFKDYFVLVHSFGGGNPHYIELIKKATGKNIFHHIPAWIDADEKKECLLYSDNDVPGLHDKMTLLNVSTGDKKEFSFPKDIFDGPQVLQRIQIKRLTAKELVIQYETVNGTKTRVYER